MFHDLPKGIRDRMRYLEECDRRDRAEGVARMRRLRQIPPETGRFISILAAAAPAGLHLEIGTSAGYSAMWLALACREKGCRLVTCECLDEKVRLARETLRLTGLDAVVELVQCDARRYVEGLADIAFCFLDAEKEIYGECYERLIPRMVPGGILVADNAVSHAEDLGPMLDRALADERVDTVVVPVGKGELLCRKR